MSSFQTLFNVSLILSVIQQIPWTIIFLFLQFYGIRLYTLVKKEYCQKIQKKVGSWCSHMADGNKGHGYTCGYWYIMYIELTENENGQYYKITFIATESSYKKLTADIDEINSSDDNSSDEDKKLLEKDKINAITIYERIGSYYNNWFKKRTLKSKIIAKIDQQEIINQIIKHQAIHKNTIVYIHGEPNVGKSMIGLLLSFHYNSYYCNTLVPWRPGDTLASLYDDVDPSEDKPLIVVFEEIDTALIKIHVGIEPHKSLPILISDKSSWNNFMDNVKRGLYPNLIILLTSNKSPDFINNLDTSYIREGRVDLIFKMI